MPILCGIIEGGKNKLAVEIAMENLWKEKCKNVSGIDVDLERNNRLYQERESCKNAAIDAIQLQQDIATVFPNLTFYDSDSISSFTFSDKHKTNLIAMTGKCVELGLHFYKNIFVVLLQVLP